MYGDEYKAVRDAVAKAVVDGNVEQIEEVCEVFKVNLPQSLLLQIMFHALSIISLTNSCKPYSFDTRDRISFCFKPVIYIDK